MDVETNDVDRQIDGNSIAKSISEEEVEQAITRVKAKGLAWDLCSA